MLSIMGKLFRIGILLIIAYLFSTQVLNVRNPISIEKAIASEGTSRIKGYTYDAYAHRKIGNMQVTLTKPDGTKVTVYSKTASPDDPERGYFEFTGAMDVMPDGQYYLNVSGGGYARVARHFSLSSLPSGEHDGVDVTAELTRPINPIPGHIYLSYFLFWY